MQFKPCCPMQAELEATLQAAPQGAQGEVVSQVPCAGLAIHQHSMQAAVRMRRLRAAWLSALFVPGGTGGVGGSNGGGNGGIGGNGGAGSNAAGPFPVRSKGHACPVVSAHRLACCTLLGSFMAAPVGTLSLTCQPAGCTVPVLFEHSS